MGETPARRATSLIVTRACWRREDSRFLEVTGSGVAMLRVGSSSESWKTQ